ncbi:translation protein [Tribonema minus]|uniref:Large ribosomal subunit protein uL3m n=1 Tax=Tribonema minus TaxID=303371 RepID=A0A835Z1M4_9STRA|nr:translation protein [Tribonema minus]
MTQIWDAWGERHAVTVLHLDACQVTQVCREETHGYTAVQVGAGEAKPKNVRKSLAGLFAKAGVPPKRRLGEFRVTPDALLPVGFRLRAQHFVPGQLIDVRGTTKGKGFQGGMKRWNFKGQRASHGVSKTHRHIGSTGQCQDPGRVFKGKKMPGRMGGTAVTVQCLRILKLDTQRDLLFVKGHVPGPRGAFLRVQDALKRAEFPAPPPFPSYAPPPHEGEGEEVPLELFAPVKESDPLVGFQP